MTNQKNQFLEDMERLFGSDAALGVYFERDDDGSKLTAAEYSELFARLGTDAPDASSYLPHGGSGTCCTDYAAHIFMALPGRVKIHGFANEDNPSSRVAREEIHPGGHDFAVVDGRFIVDPWPRLVPAAFDQMVFDLGDSADAALALDIYGPQTCWTHMLSMEQYCHKESHLFLAPVIATNCLEVETHKKKRGRMTL